MRILNLTQHAATAEQIEAGVIEPGDAAKKEIQNQLTFDTIPDRAALEEAAKSIALLAAVLDIGGFTTAMIGGAPYLMSALESALKDVGIEAVYAFSKRESNEIPDGNGGVRKVTVFRHLGFVGVM
jgi:hypothetical protein